MFTKFLITNSSAVARYVLEDLVTFTLGKLRRLGAHITTSSLYIIVRVLVVAGFIGLALSAAALEYSLLYNFIIPITFQSAEIPLHMEVEDGVSHKQGSLPLGTDVIVENEEYELAVVLTMPESQINFEVGNFDVVLTFSDDRRMAAMVRLTQGILKYSSYVLRTSRTFIYFIPLLLGWTEEAQVVRVLLNTSFNNYDELKSVRLQIFPSELQVYKAELQLATKLWGLRLIMHRYFYSSIFISVSALFFINCVVFVAVFYLRCFNAPTPVAVRTSRRSRSVHIDVQGSFEIVPRPEAQQFPSDFSHVLKTKSKGMAWWRMVVFR
jgi:hypothetical protein